MKPVIQTTPVENWILVENCASSHVQLIDVENCSFIRVCGSAGTVRCDRAMVSANVINVPNADTECTAAQKFISSQVSNTSLPHISAIHLVLWNNVKTPITNRILRNASRNNTDYQ